MYICFTTYNIGQSGPTGQKGIKGDVGSPGVDGQIGQIGRRGPKGTTNLCKISDILLARFLHCARSQNIARSLSSSLHVLAGVLQDSCKKMDILPANFLQRFPKTFLWEFLGCFMCCKLTYKDGYLTIEKYVVSRYIHRGG